MKIAVAGSRTSKNWRTQDITWQQMLDRLRQFKRTGETMAEYHRMSRDEQAARKDVGGFVGGALNGKRRTNGAVTERWLITLDADNNASMKQCRDFAALFGYEMAVYSTHSSTPDKLRLRYILPMTRAVSRDEYGAIARWVAARIDIESMDTSTYQPERLMYWPSYPEDADPVFEHYRGDTLDPDEVLSMYGDNDAWRNMALWPTGSREDEVVRRDAQKQGDPTTKPGIVGKFCRAYDVEEAIASFLPDVYDKCETWSGKPRYTYSAGSSSGGAVVEDGGKFLYSHHATDPASETLCNAFDLVRIHKFGAMDEGKEQQEITRRPSYQAMCDFAVQDEGFRRSVLAERLEGINADFADICVDESAADAVDAADETDGRGEPDKDADIDLDLEWTNALTLNGKTGEVEQSIENAECIMRNDPRLKGAIALNRLSGRIVIRRALPWRQLAKSESDNTWRDSDDSNLMLYLERCWKLTNEGKIRHAFAVVAEENAYHPIREYLDALPDWDGVERVDELLIRYMAAEDNPYVRAATRKWMCAAVKRIYTPGCKFDDMIVLVGKQGLGKSRLPMTLSRGWFTDSLTGLGTKEAFESIAGAWIVELAELAATKRAEVETIKNFISKQEDTFRPAYGRNVVTKPRQCVFFGTTNEVEFLRDRTGNRRFWPITVQGVGRGELHGLEDEVDQLWAEAKYYAMVRNETLWMDNAELYAMATAAQQEHTTQDELTGILQAALDKPIPVTWDSLTPEEKRDFMQGGVTALGADTGADNGEGMMRRDRVCITEIRVEILGEDRTKNGGNDTLSRRIANVMNVLDGWTRGGAMNTKDYGKQRAYYRNGGQYDPDKPTHERLKKLDVLS